jgi:hypothetical protein
LGKPSYVNLVSSANTATQSKNHDKQRTDRVLDQVRQNQLQKKRGRPRASFDVARFNRDELEFPTVRATPNEDVPTRDSQIDKDSQTIPSFSQAHERPFAVIKPPNITNNSRYLSAEPNNLQPSRKKREKVEELDRKELRLLLKHHPNRIPTAMLKQEVRGVTITDLLSQPVVRKHVKGLIIDKESLDHYREVNVVTVSEPMRDAKTPVD